jgi:two-component system, chemotaxis family, CheB/CheR fusion protein
MTAPDQTSIFEALLEYLRRSRGCDLRGYKRSTIQRRVTKRMQIHNIDNVGDYLEYLKTHPAEFSALFNTILINVTSFFRDLTAWEYLASHTLPQIIQHKSPDEPLRFWTAGCASGEEACTLAILLAETLGMEACLRRVKIYATDIDEDALAQARNASYSAKALEAIPTDLQQQYFKPLGDRFILDENLRRVVIFGRHDLIHDAPISRLDLLVCRNTLMYFNTETQKQILSRFHFALKNTGFLFLGKAEMLLTHAELFNPFNLPHRIFTKAQKMDRRDRLLILAQNRKEESGTRFSFNIRLLEAAFNAVPIAQIVVDAEGDLILANQLARSRFGIQSQDLGRQFKDLEISYRPVELQSQIERAYKEGRSILVSDVIRTWTYGSTQYLDIEISPLYQNEQDPLGVSIAFNEVTRYHQLQEQLQRSNQELETVNEELQSSNEELQTMNDELGRRTLELNQCNAFLESIFASLPSPIIVVDRKFQIQSWNEAAQNFWGLSANTVLSQSLFSLDIGLPLEQLRDPLYTCLSGSQPSQEIFLETQTLQGRAIQGRLTLNPLKDGGKKPHGVILLIQEI